jgi:hypothetical protein
MSTSNTASQNADKAQAQGKSLVDQASETISNAYNAVADTLTGNSGNGISDTGRKDTHSKIGDALKPDSEKSTLEKAGDKISGAADKVARDVVPDSQKSTSQSLSDKVSRATD